MARCINRMRASGELPDTWQQRPPLSARPRAVRRVGEIVIGMR